MLSDADFKIVYTSGEAEPSDFFFNALCNSISFDLGLGFFHSSGFQALAFGFAKFIIVGGSMRIIINDQLKPEDKEAIERGGVTAPAMLIEDKIWYAILTSFSKFSVKGTSIFLTAYLGWSRQRSLKSRLSSPKTLIKE